MGSEQEAQEAMTCARCGRFSGPEVLCARCDEETHLGPKTEFEPGAAVTWLSVPRGGYGYVWPVDGTVVRSTSTRVIIRVRKRSGEEVERAVRPETLRLRHAQPG